MKTPASRAFPAPDVAPPRASLSADIRATLQSEIESGVLPPGAPIDERALAARFDVSRTPVREALQHLAVRELVKISPRQGMTVARLSITKVRSMLEYIGELEAMAARFAARRVDDTLREALDDALRRCQQAAVEGSARDYAAANQRFHEAIYAGSRNACLADEIRHARRLSERYRTADFRNRSQITRSLADHLDIARAIQAGNEPLAAETMLRHVPAGSTGFSEFLAAVPPHFFDADPGDAS
jgi:DNA-binding GntR family transcriptional regulator